jgi:magnesium-transporting ATPase (P-type)
MEREKRAQALGAWGEKNPKRTSSYSLFNPTNKIRSINLPLQHTYMHVFFFILYVSILFLCACVYCSCIFYGTETCRNKSIVLLALTPPLACLSNLIRTNRTKYYLLLSVIFSCLLMPAPPN